MAEPMPKSDAAELLRSLAYHVEKGRLVGLHIEWSEGDGAPVVNLRLAKPLEFMRIDVDVPKD